MLLIAIVTRAYKHTYNYHLLNVYIANWKITMFKLGKSTISMGHGFYGTVTRGITLGLFVGNFILPNDFQSIIFQRGRYHQPDKNT